MCLWQAKFLPSISRQSVLWLIWCWHNCHLGNFWMGKKYTRGTYFRWRPHQQSKGYRSFDHVGLNFDDAGTTSAMTYVLVLSAKARRNEQLTWAIMAYSGHCWYEQVNFWLEKLAVVSISWFFFFSFSFLQSSWFLYSYTGKKLHRLALLHIWHIVSQVIGYGRLYSTWLTKSTWPFISQFAKPMGTRTTNR